MYGLRVGQLAVPGGTLAYEVAGEGRPIVLLHAAIADRRMWDREFPRLARSHRVARYDYRGYGGSPPADSPFSYVADLKAMVDGLDPPRPVILGASLGGRIAIDFAVTYPKVPSGLVLMASAGPSGLTAEMLPEAQGALAADDAASRALVAGQLDPVRAHEHRGRRVAPESRISSERRIRYGPRSRSWSGTRRRWNRGRPPRRRKGNAKLPVDEAAGTSLDVRSHPACPGDVARRPGKCHKRRFPNRELFQWIPIGPHG